MRVLMLTEAVVAGGAELFALRLTDHLQRIGVKCDLLCLHPHLLDTEVAATRPQVPVRAVTLPAVRLIRGADRVVDPLAHQPLRTWLTCRWIDQHLPRYDVVHSHLFGADWIAAAIKRRHPQVRLVSTLHGDYRIFDGRAGSVSERSAQAQWPRRRDRVLAAVDRFVYISAEQREQFVHTYGVSDERLIGIYNGVERPTRLGASPDPPPFKIVMVARGTIPEKGWEPLLKAFGALRGDVRLQLVGDGANLRALEARYGDDRRISFMGYQPAPAAIIAQAHVLALPTTYRAESLPTVIAEALSVGCPVIATDVGEIPAMLASGGGLAGTLLRSGDETLVEQLRRALQQYVDDPAIWREHAVRTPSAFARFDMTTCTQSYAELYASLLAEPARTSSIKANH